MTTNLFDLPALSRRSGLLAEAAAMADQLVAWRRRLHANPELTDHEEQTAAWVAAQLRAMGYEPQVGIGGVHSVVARIGAGDGSSGAQLGGNDAACIALRADMDALPIQEQTGLEYRSTRPGVMHACGHDAHTAMLLGAAALLARRRDKLKKPVKLIFQPAEEAYPGGAAPLVRAGVLDDVESIFGIHIWTELPSGKFGTRPGPFMASVNRLRITVTGKGGHAAGPHQCNDPIVIAAQIITALQTVVSRSISMTDSAVVSITQVNAGTADNVIPGTVEMTGTIRTLDTAVRERVCARIREIAEGIARAFGATATVVADPGYPVLVNDAAAVSRAVSAARSLGLPEEDVRTLEPIGGAEDFAYYCQARPGCFAFLGARNPAKGCDFPHHHPRFNIDEDVLPLGAALHVQYCLEDR